ncbi:hypothetical protein LI99_20180 [Mycolicibacterium smegmatis]|uniref:Uncharacterized protein n=2 Tax=Mycolicibacterium smegmatis (strain ATCC 700084 / mc(2)155) TaxID=246196 RepID=I7G4B4_MYCS2|nr:hypothetical protein MSMEG_4068 [Mycolicibacterium smegmatis MC2 155]AIU15795.1 hypothetical protein LI99_20180 [Mycolicibacterium smegmatis]AFP40427.1 hypothetical protein MSMEI_3969 [Mycolicibacterium smegmatis MC2 155]AIU09170.1 hypothetical protein LJ00_20175 [Mycolicibacterium smegmatis MC2 155]AIU22418.1 hypothetical protein LI98_20185 [Mycolicibacterium smegmatis]
MSASEQPLRSTAEDWLSERRNGANRPGSHHDLQTNDFVIGRANV